MGHNGVSSEEERRREVEAERREMPDGARARALWRAKQEQSIGKVRGCWQDLAVRLAEYEADPGALGIDELHLIGRAVQQMHNAIARLPVVHDEAPGDAPEAPEQ